MAVLTPARITPRAHACRVIITDRTSIGHRPWAEQWTALWRNVFAPATGPLVPA